MKKRIEIREDRLKKSCGVCKHRLSNPFKHKRRCEQCFLSRSRFEFDTDHFVLVPAPEEEE